MEKVLGSKFNSLWTVLSAQSEKWAKKSRRVCQLFLRQVVLQESRSIDKMKLSSQQKVEVRRTSVWPKPPLRATGGLGPSLSAVFHVLLHSRNAPCGSERGAQDKTVTGGQRQAEIKAGLRGWPPGRVVSAQGVWSSALQVQKVIFVSVLMVEGHLWHQQVCSIQKGLMGKPEGQILH